MTPIRRVLISVYHKEGVADFAAALAREWGCTLISTGGTARTLRNAGLRVLDVSDLTGFPEILSGRVKTLHPAIHAALLADRDHSDHIEQLESLGIEPIDLVVADLYPFIKAASKPGASLPDIIEMIDIGGPTLIRAAAKNHAHVAVITRPDQRATVLENLRKNSGAISPDLRLSLAAEAFQRVEAYDAAISDFFDRLAFHPSSAPTRVGGPSTIEGPAANENPEAESLSGESTNPPPTPGRPLPDPIRNARSALTLRYGENPHQTGELFRLAAAPSGHGRAGLADARHLSGEALSYNNLLDADAALRICADLARQLSRSCGSDDKTDGGALTHFSDAICIFVKHGNPCGVGMASEPLVSYEKAYLGDPNAAMGGVLACSFPVNADFARDVMETYQSWGRTAGAGGFFLEVWLAPIFSPEAVMIIQRARPWGQRVRLLEFGHALDSVRGVDFSWSLRTITGGLLFQRIAEDLEDETTWRIAGRVRPPEAAWPDIRLAWLTCKHVMSNAITICRDGMLLGAGAGQTSRITSCRLARWLAEANGHAARLKGAVAASDAFFPFEDGPKILLEAGVTGLIHPGGGKRDGEIIRACDEAEVFLITTSRRHFRH